MTLHIISLDTPLLSDMSQKPKNRTKIVSCFQHWETVCFSDTARTKAEQKVFSTENLTRLKIFVYHHSRCLKLDHPPKCNNMPASRDLSIGALNINMDGLKRHNTLHNMTEALTMIVKVSPFRRLISGVAIVFFQI